jgi:nucleotide-binding universal stress UspA family protein
MRATALATGDPVEIVVLHVGEGGRAPAIDLPEAPNCTWKTESREGEVVEQILPAAEEYESDLIIMTTEGRDGILDALRGGVTQQVVRGAHCPLLAVTVG